MMGALLMPILRSIPNDATPSLGTAEYLWVKDGILNSKTRVITTWTSKNGEVIPIIEWWTTSIQDLEFLLLPAQYVPNPLRPKSAFIVLCEMRDLKDVVVEWNTRAPVRAYEPRMTRDLEIWLGIEGTWHLPPEHDEKATNIREAFLAATIDSGILVHSVSWNSFKVGPRMSGGLDTDPPSPLIVCDQYWIAWYLLSTIAGSHGAVIGQAVGIPNQYYVSTKTSRESPKIAKQISQNMTALDNVRVYITAPNRGYTTIRGVTASNKDPYVVAADVVRDIFAGIEGNTRG
jgi:hypothetical protein